MISIKQRIARLSTLNPWSALSASVNANKPESILRQSEVALALTLSAPIFIGVSEEHNEFVDCEGLQVRNWENLGEPVTESFGLQLRSLPNDRVQNFMYIFFDVV